MAQTSWLKYVRYERSQRGCVQLIVLLGAQPALTSAALPLPSVEQCVLFNHFIEITLPEERTNNSNFLIGGES